MIDTHSLEPEEDHMVPVNDEVAMSDEIAGNLHIFDEYHDQVYTDLLTHLCIGTIEECWFRSELVGFDTMPKRNNPERPLIFASNHSGMSFPWDAMVVGSKINWKHYDNHEGFRPLASPMLSMSTLMNPFQIPNLWKRVGGIDATFLNFETLMFNNNQHLLIYPEGVPGIGKGFNRRYQLQEIRTSMIRMSVKYKTDIIPFSTVNAEYSNPYSYSSAWVNKLFNLIGVPFMALGPITLLLFLQPWSFYIALPANMVFVRGKRISPHQWTDKPYDEITQEEFMAMAKRVHAQMQQELNDAVAKYGKRPYKWGGLFKKMVENWRQIPYILPTGWPLIFTEFDRLYKKQGKDTKINLGFLSTIRILFRNPFLIFFYIPIIGWIPLLIRGFRNSNIRKIRM